MPSKKPDTIAESPPEPLSWDNVLAWRMRRQHLQQRVPADAALGVVSDLCGLHAQVMSSAELTLWARVDGLDREAVQRMLWDERTLVKTWAVRGTLHLLPAGELPTWIAAQSLLKPRYQAASWQRAFGVSAADMEAMLDALPTVLGGTMLNRDELAAAVAAETGHAHLAERLRESWGAVLKPAAFAGVLCFAPNDGRNVRFTYPPRWLGSWQSVAADEAIVSVVRRYLRVYGPATRDEFARWFGATSPAQAERLIKQLGDEAATVDLAGSRAWLLATDVADAAEMQPSGATRLLPAFDQYVVTAPRDQEAVLPAERRDRVYRPQGWFSPVVVTDGRIAGIWRHERKGGRIEISVVPFARLSPSQSEQVAAEADRLAQFLDGTPSLTIAPPD